MKLAAAAGGDDAMAEPDELRGEPRWSSIRYAPHPQPAQWSRATDEKLLLLVTQSTASGERFPVGVNCACACLASTLHLLSLYKLGLFDASLVSAFPAAPNVDLLDHTWQLTGLEVSRVLRRSPVDCVKRYAFLHDARERYNAMDSGEEQQAIQQYEAKADEEQELDDALLYSEDDELELDQQSLGGFATPVMSPKLQSLDTSGGFACGPGSPGSPPPFAVARAASRPNAGGSPFRWESLVNDPKYTAPVLNSPPSLRPKLSFQGRFGLDDDEAKASRKISNSGRETAILVDIGSCAAIDEGAWLWCCVEYPFLKEEDMSARQSAASSANSSFRVEARGAPFLSDAYNTPDAAAGDLQQQMNAHLMRMSAMSGMSSFHGDNPFTGSVTQSALEDAFLDMAGSRLDASSVLLGSRMATLNAQSRLEQMQALERERDAASKPRD
ncbi:hypothetical protein BBJ28_00016643 [Nothophytophthora sp. Chile5]|nr:hypothetical protein BBJ28_00016643 [Nothophytophthora sp. Chile5]